MLALVVAKFVFGLSRETTQLILDIVISGFFILVLIGLLRSRHYAAAITLLICIALYAITLLG